MARDDDNDDATPEHPADKNFNYPINRVKNAVKSGLQKGVKWAALGAAGTAVLSAAPLLLGFVPVIGWVAAPIGLATAGLTYALGGYGAAMAYSFGVGALWNAGEELLTGEKTDLEKEQNRQNYDRLEKRQHYNEAMADSRDQRRMVSRQQAKAMGIVERPNLPYARDTQQQRG